MRKKISVTLALSLLVLYSGFSLAISPIYMGGPSKLAIKGYDPVAYFTLNQAVKGFSHYQTIYKDTVWQFSSESHLNKFLKEPEKYTPQYGGYCAYAVSRNTTASIKPEYFTIHEGKLYLNYNKGVMKKWLKNKEKYIAEANETWPRLVER